MKSIFFLLNIFLFSSLFCFGQTIEEYFKENKIPELYVPFTVDDDGRFVFLKRKNTMRRMSIALFEKRDSTWIGDEKRSIKTDIPLENIAWVLDSLPSGSKIIHMGLSTYRSQRASFKIPEGYKVGDTLSFKFCILAAYDYIKFHPKVYFSKRYFITRRGKEFFKDNWSYAGPLPVASRNTHDLQEVEISIILTKKLKKLRWIHIQNNMWRGDIGYLLPYSLKDVQRIIEDTVTSTKDSANVKVYFENDSYALSDEAKEAIRDLMLMTKSENNIYERVELSGYADKSGDLNHNLILAGKRVESIRMYLIEGLGIPPERIKVLETGIGHFGTAEENRVCILELK